MCADFQYYLNRTGPRGPQGYKGDKGDDGKTPVPRTGTNTPIETTVIFDTGDGNPYETPNLKYPIEDRGGNIVMLDRTNSTQYYGTPDQATGNSYGVVKLATSESVLDDPLDSDVVTYELFDDNNQAIKATTDGLAGDITQLNTDLGAEATNRTNADTQLTNKINTDVGNEATARNNADIALSGRIDGLNSSKANKSDVYTKTQTDSLLSNKSNVGHTHNYNDLTNKPTIGNGTITFKQGNTTVGTITTNQLSNSTLTFADPTGVTPGAGLSLDSSTNVLSVKIDNDTLGINSDGEIEVQNAGATYSEGNAIDLTNDTISVKYDNNTLKLNGSGELYADIPAANDATITITQGGVTKGSFTTNQGTNGTIALDAGPDMSGYYTKTQTDSLLDEKIDNDIVQYPLQYLPDTTSGLNTQNVNTSTMVGSGLGIGFDSQDQSNPNYNAYDTNNTRYDLRSYPEAINLENLCWFETRLTNGLNIGFKGNSYAPNAYVYALGHYNNNNIFILDALIQAGYSKCSITVIDGNNPSQTWLQSGGYGADTSYTVGGCSLDNTTLRIRTENYSSNTTISSSAKEILDQVTHIRVFKGYNGNSGVTLSLSDIKVINPTLSQNNCGNTMNSTVFGNYDNIFDAHPASLSLKYDSNTLGINANNELTVPTATTSNKGLVQPDGTTIGVNSSGQLQSLVEVEADDSTTFVNANGKISAITTPALIIDTLNKSAVVNPEAINTNNQLDVVTTKTGAAKLVLSNDAVTAASPLVKTIDNYSGFYPWTVRNGIAEINDETGVVTFNDDISQGWNPGILTSDNTFVPNLNYYCSIRFTTGGNTSGVAPSDSAILYATGDVVGYTYYTLKISENHFVVSIPTSLSSKEEFVLDNYLVEPNNIYSVTIDRDYNSTNTFNIFIMNQTTWLPQTETITTTATPSFDVGSRQLNLSRQSYNVLTNINLAESHLPVGGMQVVNKQATIRLLFDSETLEDNWGYLRVKPNIDGGTL